MLPIATLPFHVIPPLELGPLVLNPFGFLVGLAGVVAVEVAGRRAARMGLDKGVMAWLYFWAIAGGWVGAHVYSALFYFPERTLADPLYLLKLWDGISSFGGFIGATLGVLGFLLRRRLPVAPHADVMLYGFAFGWIFGRTACWLVFDHPGLPTDFVLGMAYPLALEGLPKGTIRHNLGFYEMLYTLLICAVIWHAGRRPRPPGWITGVVLVLYAPVRFGLDFLRATDKQYLGLTAGQYAAVALLAIGFWLLRSTQKEACPEALRPS